MKVQKLRMICGLEIITTDTIVAKYPHKICLVYKGIGYTCATPAAVANSVSVEAVKLKK